MRQIAVFLAVLALILAPALAPLAGAAGASGTAYLPAGVDLTGVYEKVVVDKQAVSIPANSTEYINYTLPGWVESVVVKVEGASGEATLEALDANNNVVATASIVPLASGYTVTLPPSATKLAVKNLATSIWNGTITIIVKTTVDVRLEFQQTQITLENGQAIVPATIIVKNLPEAGSLSLGVFRASPGLPSQWSVDFADPNDVDNDGKTIDDTYIYVPAHTDPNNPATYDVQVKIFTTAKPGTYTVTIRMYHDTVRLDADITMTATISDDGSGQATVQPDDNGSQGIPWMWLGVGIIAGFLAVAILRGGK